VAVLCEAVQTLVILFNSGGLADEESSDEKEKFSDVHYFNYKISALIIDTVRHLINSRLSGSNSKSGFDHVMRIWYSPF